MGAFDPPEAPSLRTKQSFVGSLGATAPRLVGVGALSPEECVAFLASSQIGRIAASIGALPVILPVNYLVFDNAVWFGAPADGMLLGASVGSVVAFEADGYDPAGSLGWSVLVRGVAVEVTEPGQLAAVRERFLDARPLVEQADRFIVVPATMLTGQRYARVA